MLVEMNCKGLFNAPSDQNRFINPAFVVEVCTYNIFNIIRVRNEKEAKENGWSNEKLKEEIEKDMKLTFEQEMKEWRVIVRMDVIEDKEFFFDTEEEAMAKHAELLELFNR